MTGEYDSLLIPQNTGFLFFPFFFFKKKHSYEYALNFMLLMKGLFKKSVLCLFIGKQLSSLQQT